MGAQQVLRKPGRLALRLALLLLATGASAGDARADAPAPTPVVVVDLRPGEPDDRRATREAFQRELGAIQGVELVADPELASALVADPEPPVDRDVRKRAADRMSAVLAKRSAGDCSARGAAARDAIADLAALEAAGRKVRPELTLAYVYVLRCAHRAGDATGAARAAAMLRAIGHTEAPPEVEPAEWTAYPPVGPGTPGAVRITSAPEGAAIWIDHQPVGTAPVEASPTQGPHLVSAASADGVGSQWIEVGDATVATASIVVALERTPRRWGTARSLVASWRSGAAGANALAIARLMTETGVRYAILVSSEDRAELWHLPVGANAAERVRQASLRAPMVIGAALSEAAGATPAADDSVPILTEDAKKREQRKQQKWWVYAGIIGAVAVGAGIILANDLADDRQRIELTWP
ncbi:MAG TPA: PEGA domain-containing protein [Kofleriaceae bacterium]|nr:PEGA domain-containing protein [Kofleriaceae bacterium]